jgi:hypothetical protein
LFTIIAFLLAGLVLLLFVNEAKGRAAVATAEGEPASR